MNKNIMIPLVALMILAMVGAASADEMTTVDTIEVRGNVESIAVGAGTNAVLEWNATNFAAFWYDLDDDLQTETLTLAAGTISADDRTIDEDNLTYTTVPVYQQYELNEAGMILESGVDNRAGYFIEGWMAEKYVAIDGNADKLAKLLVEFEDDDKKTLSTGEAWDLGGGFSLTVQQIDLEGEKCWLTLEKDGKELDSEVVSTGAAADTKNDSVYTYTADLAGEDDVPVFHCFVDAVFRGTDTNIVQLMYVFLTDDDVLEIEVNEQYGAMEVVTANSNQIVVRNDEDTLDVDADTTELIMGNMYFKTADNDLPDGDGAARFYPMVEYTIGGVPADVDDEIATPEPTEAEPADGNVSDGEGEGEGADGEGADGEGEVVANATATAEVTETDEPEAEETATPEKTPGFEAVFAISGLLAIAYLVLRQRD